MTIRTIGSNQAEVRNGEKTILVSYNTPVAVHIEGEGFFRTATRFSVTTSKHINKWLAFHNATPAKVMIIPQESLNQMLAG